MKRFYFFVTIALAALLFGATLGACGNGLMTGEDPELRVDTTIIELGDMAPSSRSRTQTAIEIENTGPGTLRIESIEWISKPDRVEAYYRGANSEDGVGCASDDQCSGNAVCLTNSGHCRDRGLPEFPIEVASNSVHTQSLVLLADEDNPVICPEPTSESVPNNYCGELLIRTNAPNTVGDEENSGVARVFLVSDGTSGMLSVPRTVVEFVLATPGVTQALQFDIENSAASPLTMERIHFGTNSTWFDVTPSPNGLVIEGNSSQTFTLEMTPPESATEEDLEFASTMGFDSSSISFAPAMSVLVTAGPGDVPIIEVEPLQLSFADSTTQTVTVRNVGTAPLPMHQVQVRPIQVEDYYSVYFEGDEISGGGANIPTVPSGSEIEFTVEFHAPADPGVSTVGDLQINHGDNYADNRSIVSLLGDANEVAVGAITPSQVNFLSEGGDQIRELMIINSGNADLVIDDYHLEASGSTDAGDYSVDGLDGLVLGANELGTFSISYTGDNQFGQSLSLSIDSNHAGQSETMRVNISGSHMTDPTMDVDIDPSFPDRALVGQVAGFHVSDSTGQAQLDLARWVTLARPAGSEAVLQGTGETATFSPDVAGDYRVAVIVRDGDGREVQKDLEFEAEN